MEDEAGLPTAWHSTARRLPAQIPLGRTLGHARTLGPHPGLLVGIAWVALDRGAGAWEQDGGRAINGHPLAADSTGP